MPHSIIQSPYLLVRSSKITLNDFDSNWKNFLPPISLNWNIFCRFLIIYLVMSPERLLPPSSPTIWTSHFCCYIVEEVRWSTNWYNILMSRNMNHVWTHCYTQTCTIMMDYISYFILFFFCWFSWIRWLTIHWNAIPLCLMWWILETMKCWKSWTVCEINFGLEAFFVKVIIWLDGCHCTIFFLVLIDSFWWMSFIHPMVDYIFQYSTYVYVL